MDTLIENTIGEVIEKGERCNCGGEVDTLYLVQRNPDIWAGRCFQCGKRFTVIGGKRQYNARILECVKENY